MPGGHCPPYNYAVFIYLALLRLFHANAHRPMYAERLIYPSYLKSRKINLYIEIKIVEAVP